ncbi:hypothetical protein B0H15DRAFT_839790 [Mycena belliarum]|uniref:Response regulatory domain-containing protein n=1 Tax=Mycena belliarum TaxID=1033014 RepID=A0AAD6XUR5_9AGAR|nr:hypothetical protein B0H15DRAFT_839790 [Mycena belliae]
MQGSIVAKSRKGVGTSFTVVFPVQDIEVAPPGTPRTMRRQHISPVPPPLPSEPDAVAAASDPPPLPAPHAISRKILVAMLKRLNATAYQAEDGLAALDVFEEVHPHVVWTDVSMPRMDGVTSAKEMRRMEREKGWAPCHIVAITGLGLTDEHIRREALLGPAALDGWLIKGQTNMNSLKKSLVAVRLKLSRTHPHPGVGPP